MPKSAQHTKRYLVDIRDTIVVALSRYVGLSNADICEVMGMHKSVVSRILARERQRPFVEKLIKKIRT